MKVHTIPYAILILVAVLIESCGKKDAGVAPPGNRTDTVGPLKSATTMPVGFAIDYSSFNNNNLYRTTVLREVNSITPGNEMKHSSIVQSDGTYNFTTADAMVNAALSNGIAVYGHVLGWHSQQNAGYLKSYAGLVSQSATELLTNEGFESSLSGWSIFNTDNGATVTATTAAAEVHTGNGAMKVVNPVANPGGPWKVQVASDFFTTTIGKQYTISYWVKGAAAGGTIRLSTQTSGGGSAQYQSDQIIGSSWQQVSWTITANAAQTRFLFDMGQAANTYFIDDASVREVMAGTPGPQVATKLDAALNSWITAIVSRYAGKVRAWDVINELFTESGAIRNNANTLGANPSADVFVWSEYLGRDFALKAFNYAKAADPNALLFINDYNLETTGTAKLDSLVAFVKELQARGAKIDGIGTQMHTSINASYSAIDNMFQKLATTGLKVRISELDISVNPYNTAGFTATEAVYANQAVMYKYIISSYIRNVPAAQRYGVTFWGVDDASSWIVTVFRKTDYPLLFDKNFNKKPAYTTVLQALKGL